MGYDPFSPIAPALINVLCVPAHGVTPDTFIRFTAWLRNVVGVLVRESPVIDSASNPSSGKINQLTLLFNYSTTSDTQERERLLFFEPNRQPCLILGLVDGSVYKFDDAEPERLRQATEKATSAITQNLALSESVELPTKIIIFDAVISRDIENVAFVDSESESADPMLAEWLRKASMEQITSTLTQLRSQDVALPIIRKAPNGLHGNHGQDATTDNEKRQSAITSLSQSPSQAAPIQDDSVQIGNTGRTVSAALLKLQMGLWTEALDQFADGARAARDSDLPAWHAKALEGMLSTLFLLAWSGTKFQIPQNCYPNARGLPSSNAVHEIAEANRLVSEKFAGSSAKPLQALTALLPGLVATVLNLYDRSTVGFDNVLPGVFACEARVRLAKMLILVRRCGCAVNDAALQGLVAKHVSRSDMQRLEAPSVLLVLRASSLGNLLTEALDDVQSQMDTHSVAPLCLAVCKGLAELGLDRKQGFYLKDILQRLPVTLLEARKKGNAEKEMNTRGGSPNPTMRHAQYQTSVYSSRALLKLAVRLYGLLDVFQSRNDLNDNEDGVRQRLHSWHMVFTSGDIATKLEVLRLCIRVSDALLDFTESIRFMSLLLFVVRQTVTVSKDLSNPVPLIASQEQDRLAVGISNAVQAVQAVRKMHGPDTMALYWDDFMVRGVSIQTRSTTGLLVPHSSQDLSHATISKSAKSDPFIYNPFSEGQAASGLAILVENEVAMFEVTLQNPLEIEVEIETISLLTEGCNFEAHQHSIVLAPLCLQKLVIKGTPKSNGALRVIGCHAKVKSCWSRDFLIFDNIWKPQVPSKHTLSGSVGTELPVRTVLEVKVIESLPSLQIDSTSMNQNSIMLLDGERSRFSMTLQNTSNIAADLLLFSFYDSVSRQLQAILTTKDLTAADAYEIQYQLTSRSTVRQIKDDKSIKASASSAVVIQPKSSQTFHFEILGKPGLTEAVILVDYAYLGKSRSEVEGTFYTRQLRLTVSVTVNASIDMPRCNILSLPARALIQASPPSEHGQLSNFLDQEIFKSSESSLCLLQLDLRSIWQSPLTFTIETLSVLGQTTALPLNTHESWSTVSTSLLQPAQTERVLIPISRIYIADPYDTVPTLNTATAKRQFVVSASKLSLEAEATAREAFWYREELCRRLRISWQEEHGSRRGEIDIHKGIRLNPRTIDALKVEHVQISFHLKTTDSKLCTDVAVIRSSQFKIKRKVFATLVVTVQNLTSGDLKLLLRLQPSLHDQPHNIAMDLNKKLVWSGVLQRILKDTLQPGQTAQVELGMVALARTVYLINATVEEVQSRPRELNGLPGQGANLERRIWHARRPCLIHAVD